MGALVLPSTSYIWACNFVAIANLDGKPSAPAPAPDHQPSRGARPPPCHRTQSHQTFRKALLRAVVRRPRAAIGCVDQLPHDAVRLDRLSLALQSASGPPPSALPTPEGTLDHMRSHGRGRRAAAGSVVANALALATLLDLKVCPRAPPPS